MPTACITKSYFKVHFFPTLITGQSVAVSMVCVP